MRIISKFHDYYDSAMSFGIDQTLLYLREQKEYEYIFYRNTGRVKEKIFPNDMGEILDPVLNILKGMPIELDICSKGGWVGRICTNPKLIGFCGKIYPALQYSTKTNYSVDSFLEDFKNSDRVKLNRIKEEKIMEAVTKKVEVESFWSNSYLTYENWEKIEEQLKDKNFDNAFVGLKVPIFTLQMFNRTKYVLTLNPELRLSSFQKIKTPTECFQEISMFLGNQLAYQSEPPVSISDEVLLQKKGFDKWSFRKHKEDNKNFAR